MSVREGDWNEFERLRQLVPERADFHLYNWGMWRRGSTLTESYRERSAGLSTGGISGTDAFEHLCEAADSWAAEVSDSIIEELPFSYRLVLSHVYEASVWTFRQSVDDLLTKAGEMFWDEAVRRNLT